MFRKLSSKKSNLSNLSPPAAPAAVPAYSEPSPEIIQQVEEEFPEEDSAQKREHFERLYENFSPQQVYPIFCQFIWRENAGLGEVEIVKDGPALLQAGMQRRITGRYEEELSKVVCYKMIEYRISDGTAITPSSTFFKARVLFKPESAEHTRVIWTIYWTPDSIVTSLLFTMMMKGFCNLALYRLQDKLLGNTLSTEFEKNDANEDDDSFLLPEEKVSTTGKPKLQFAARLQTGYEGNLTPEQEAGLARLRKELQSEDPASWKLCENHPDGPDRIMLRFLRAECSGGKARHFNVERSKQRLIKTLHYRELVKANDMLLHDPPKFKECTESANDYFTTDREGRLILFSRAGLLSTCLDTRIMTEEEWKINLTCVSERRMQFIRESSQKLGYEVSATVVVYDLRGLSFASRRIIPFAKMINSVASEYYPEFVDLIVVCFAPAVFAALFSSIKTFLDPVTASKVKVFGSSKSEVDKMKHVFRTLVDPSVLPKEYGGDSDVVVGYPSAYKGERFPVE